MFWFYVVSTIVVAYFLFRRWMQGRVCNIKADLTDKIVLMTGATAGIGKATAKELAKKGATIVFGVREKARGDHVAQEIKEYAGHNRVEHIPLDLESLASVDSFVRSFEDKYQRCDILINNAGVVNISRRLTKDGFENTFGVNHLAHFYLTNLLLKTLVASRARIINVASDAHYQCKGLNFDDLQFEKTPFSTFGVYGHSKLANILFTKELQKRIEGSGATAVCLHPGGVVTEIGRNGGIIYYLSLPLQHLVLKTPYYGAQTTIHCALTPNLVGGGYYSNCALEKPGPQALNREAAERLWTISEQLIKNFNRK